MANAPTQLTPADAVSYRDVARVYVRALHRLLLCSRPTTRDCVNCSQEGAAATQQLQATIQPHFLRREKSSAESGASAGGATVLKDEAGVPNVGAFDASAAATATSASDATGALSCAVPAAAAMLPATVSMPQKKEIVVWVRLCEYQLDLYRKFLESPDVAVVLNTTDSPLAALNVLRKICLHPALLNDRVRSVMNTTLEPVSTYRCLQCAG